MAHSSTAEILAYESLDCAHKVRIHYLLPAPLDLGRQELAAWVVSIQAFSHQVVGARDHFTIEAPGMFRAAGVLGGRKLVATYGKLAERTRPVEAIAALEDALASIAEVSIRYWSAATRSSEVAG